MGKSVFSYVGKKNTVNGISKNVSKMTVSAIKEMAMLGMKYPDSISLSWGLPSFGIPEHIKKAVINALKNDDRAGKYAPSKGIPELCEAIAKRVKVDRNWEIDPNKNVIVTAGAMEALTLCWHTLIDQGDEVIITDPGFSSHFEQLTLVGGKAVHWMLDESKGWELDIDKLESLITKKTKAIIICSPNNPTGKVFSEEQIVKMCEIAIKKDIFIITDEPYDFLVYDNKNFFSPAHVEKARKKIILIRSLSKEYAMSGFRLGYVVADENLIMEMLKVHDSIVICPATLSQFAAVEALNGPQDCVHEFQEELSERRKIFCELISKENDLFDFIKPEGAYYVFPKIKYPGIDAYKFAIDLLEKVKVVVVPGDAFGINGKEHVRMTFCVSREAIIEGFKRIHEYKEKYYNPSKLVEK